MVYIDWRVYRCLNQLAELELKAQEELENALEEDGDVSFSVRRELNNRNIPKASTSFTEMFGGTLQSRNMEERYISEQEEQREDSPHEEEGREMGYEKGGEMGHEKGSEMGHEILAKKRSGMDRKMTPKSEEDRKSKRQRRELNGETGVEW